MKRGSSAGGLKVKALSQTPRDAGSSPAQHYTFHLCKFTLRENYLFKIKFVWLIALYNKSTVVDESLSTNSTRVLFQRKTTSLLQKTT